MFSVGQHVECIDNSNGKGLTWIECPLQIGGVYTVVRTDTFGDDTMIVDGDPGIWWCCSRFRPLTERSTSTGFAILEEIRRKHSKKAPVKARQSFEQASSHGY